MKERGLTYLPAMAAAIWRGDKWQTRRQVKIRDGYEVLSPGTGNAWAEKHREMGYLPITPLDPELPNVAMPSRFQLGDIMIVREPWRTFEFYDEYSPSELESMRLTHAMEFYWEADGDNGNQLAREGKYRQARYMPLSFARARRKVTAVRFERLGDISEADANAEGFHRHDENGRRTNSPIFPTAAREFSVYWNRMHGPNAWVRDKHKWVEVIEFERKTGA